MDQLTHYMKKNKEFCHVFSERLAQHIEFKEKYPQNAAQSIQGKKRALANQIGIGHHLTREQYYNAIGENDIPEPPVYPQRIILWNLSGKPQFSPPNDI